MNYYFLLMKLKNNQSLFNYQIVHVVNDLSKSIAFSTNIHRFFCVFMKTK